MAKKKNPVDKLPPADEPQDIAELGPTPYEYLFAETAERIDNFVNDVKEHVKDDV